MACLCTTSTTFSPKIILKNESQRDVEDEERSNELLNLN